MGPMGGICLFSTWKFSRNQSLLLKLYTPLNTFSAENVYPRKVQVPNRTEVPTLPQANLPDSVYLLRLVLSAKGVTLC